jgi:hypothetical protein
MCGLLGQTEVLKPRVTHGALRHVLAGPQVAGKGHSTAPVKTHAEGRQRRSDVINK